jgi:hypothetical protein
MSVASKANHLPLPPSEIEKVSSTLSFTDPILERLTRRRSCSLVSPLLKGNESQEDVEALNNKRGFFFKYSKHYRAEQVLDANEKFLREEILDDPDPFLLDMTHAERGSSSLKSSLLRKVQSTERRTRKVSFSSPDYFSTAPAAQSKLDYPSIASSPTLFALRDSRQSLDTTLAPLDVNKGVEPARRRATLDIITSFFTKDTSKTRLRRVTR